MLKMLDKIPVGFLALLALMLGIAPFGSQPHLVEKLVMLFNGSLSKPIDIFDLVLHSMFSVLLIWKLLRIAMLRRSRKAEY